MSNIKLEATQSTPLIIADSTAGTLEMRGDSYPENSFEFFTPILSWLNDFLEKEEKPLRVDLHLLYLNTSSVKVMMDVFDTIEEAHDGGRDVAVIWRYNADNERIAELAEEFKEDCSFPFDIALLDE